MALVGHISGSTQSSSVIGVSGSVIVANRPESLFPTMPGNNVTFYVSGSTDGNDHSVFGGNLTSSGSLTLAGNILAHANTPRTIFADVVDITLGGAASTVNVAGDLKVSGNDIQASDGNTNITLTSNTLTTFAGDIQINGNDIKSSGGQTAITLSGANVILPGDLTVNGTTTTVDSVNLTIKDGVVGFGFVSGSTSVASGDRGWVGGLTGGNNVAMIWKNGASEFEAIYTADSAASSSITFASWADFSAGVIKSYSGFSGSLTRLTDGTSYIIGGTGITVTTGSNGSITIDGTAAAPTNARYLLVGGGSGTGQLTDERSFVAGTGLNAVDGGANGNYTISINDGIVATVSGTTFQGTIKPSQNNFYDLGATGARWYRGYIDQISGSHTQLIDGTSAFIAGTGISITTGSNGAVTISSNTPAVDDFFDSTTAGSIFTTGSAAFRGTNSSIDSPSDIGTNTFFFVSGSKGTLGAVGVDNSVFGGNLVVSGTLKVGTGFEIAEVPGVVTYLDAKTFLNISANGGGVDINDTNDIRFITPTTVKIGQTFFNVNVGSDTNFFVSGTLTGRGTSLGKISTFGGQLVASGTVHALGGISGSLTKLTDGTSYLIAGTGIAITTGSNGAVTIATSGVGNVTGPGSSTQYAVALFDDTTGKVLRNSQLTTNGTDSLWIASNLNISGSTVFGDSPSSDTVSFTARVASSVEPSADMQYNLGSPSRRWNNVFTGDLHLRNERGDYTLIEEEEFLSIRFNKTGKRYKFVLEAVPELDEPTTTPEKKAKVARKTRANKKK